VLLDAGSIPAASTIDCDKSPVILSNYGAFVFMAEHRGKLIGELLAGRLSSAAHVLNFGRLMIYAGPDECFVRSI